MSIKDEFHRRIVDWSVPPPLDRQLATLTVRNTKNDPESCNVVLNAHFGSSRLILEIEDTLLEVDCRIKQAEIRLFAANARLNFGSDFSKFKHSAFAEIDRSSTSARSGILEGESGFGLNSLGLSGGFSAKVKASATNKDAVLSASHSKKFPFNHIDFNTVTVTGLPGQEYLNGSEVVEYEGWQGTFESSDKRVGIGASILVREQWIEFSNPNVKSMGRLRKALSNIFSSKSSRKAQQFQVLLAFLVRKSLQDPYEKKYGTIACHAFVLEPGSEQTRVLQRPEELEKISIHPALIEQFANLPAGTHADFVKSVILADAAADEVYKAVVADGSTKLVAPMASPHDVLKALTDLTLANEESPQKIVEKLLEIPGNVRRDLSALGFLSSRNGRNVNDFSNFQGSPDSALLFAVADADWFTFTASILEKNGLRFAAHRVGKEVSDEFGLDWAEASQRRYGSNMKRWVAKLHPDFTDLKKHHVDYWYVRSLKSRAEAKGAVPIIYQELAEEIEYRKLMGKSYNTITKEVGISNGSYVNWKAKYPEAKKAAEVAAQNRVNKAEC